MRSFTRALFLALACAPGLACEGDARVQGSGGTNSAVHAGKPYVILVSVDGFRWDYQARFDTPALDRIAADGIRAEALLPVFPTLTFPNHYSIATGLYPAHHGLVDNTFYDEGRERRYTLSDREAVQDGTWYAGEPLWVVAEKSGMVSAAHFFIGTEADIQGVRPTYWKQFDGSIAGSDRVEQVLDWLALPEETRPHLITLYFEHVDTTSHRDGVDSPTVAAAVTLVDDFIGQLLDSIDALPIAEQTYVLVVSDHGQSGYRDEEPFVLADAIDMSGTKVVDHGTSVSLFFETPDRARALDLCDAINRRWGGGQAFVSGEAPDAWHVDPGSRFADVIVQADPGSRVDSTRGRGASAGNHGWPPGFRDMHGFFLASGPRLPKGRRIEAFENVDIYPLVLEILGLDQPSPIDGKPETLVPLLDSK